MGSLSYMLSVVDRNVVIRRIHVQTSRLALESTELPTLFLAWHVTPSVKWPRL